MIAAVDDLIFMVASLALCTVRLFVLALFIPVFRGKTMPRYTLVGVMLALGLVVVPVVHDALPRPMIMGFWFPIVVKEVFLGLLVGIVSGAVFWVLEALGVLLDQQTGSSQSSVIDPLTGHPTGPSSDFLVQTFVALILSSGAFLVLLGGIYDSYVLWPVLAPMPTLPDRFVTLFAAEFERQVLLGSSIALPFMVALVVVEVSVGLLSARALKSLDAHTFAQGLKQLTVHMLFFILIGVVFGRVLEYLAQYELVLLLERLVGRR